MENIIPVFKTPNELNKYLNSFSYGILYNNKVITDLDNTNDNDFFKMYRTISPLDFFKYKVGVCWDYTAAERYYFSKYFKYDFDTYYIEVEDDTWSTHTFLVYKEEGKFYYFESSFQKYQGVHQFDDLISIFKYVIKNMERNKYRYKIYKYDLNKFDFATLEFMDYIINNGTLIFENSITRLKKSTK